MSLTTLGWLLIVNAIVISTLLMFPLRSYWSRGSRPDLDACKTGLGDIATRLRLGTLSEAEAEAARLALLAQPRSLPWAFGQDLRSGMGPWAVAASVFFLVAGGGTATSLLRNPGETMGSVNANAAAADEAVSQLKDYARSPGADSHASAAPSGKLLPDVDTMIARLAARLEAAPNDIAGWRLLAWSYVNTQRYRQATAAFARALELEPNSAELKQAYEEAKAKASAGAMTETASLQADAATGAGATGSAASQDAPAHDGPAIRSMVDGLAERLVRSPRDVEGWTQLMRSRVVLGETDVAATNLRTALEVFKDDAAASDTIKATASELGLKSD